MSKYNHEYFLNEKYNGDAKKVLKKYKYNSVDSIRKRVDECDNNSEDELKNIINEIVLWKLNRMVFVDKMTTSKLIELKNIKSAEDAITVDKDKVIMSMTCLLNSKGIRCPMASTIMHFFNPNVFPIFDQRAYRVIYKLDYKTSNNAKENVKMYMDYLEKCIIYYKNNNLDIFFPFSEIDKYLYQLDKEIGNKVKM